MRNWSDTRSVIEVRFEHREIVVGDSRAAQIGIGAALAAVSERVGLREASGVEPLRQLRLRRAVDVLLASGGYIGARGARAEEAVQCGRLRDERDRESALERRDSVDAPAANHAIQRAACVAEQLFALPIGRSMT